MSDNDSPPVPVVDDQAPGEDLLLLQTRKAKLVQARDSLLERRDDLKESVDRLRETLQHYKQQSRQYDVKQKLEHFLHQSDLDKAHTGEDGLAFILENLSVLPSTNWTERLELVTRFTPFIKFKSISSSAVYDGDVLLRVIKFTCEAETLPSFEIELSVREEQIVTLQIPNFSLVEPVLSRISLSFTRVVKHNFVPHRKIDLLIYSYHSLARLQHIRVSTFAEILKESSMVVVRPLEWKEHESVLQTTPYVEMKIQRGDSDCHVRLDWSLSLEDVVVGNVDSRVRLTIFKGEHVFPNVDELFQSLITLHGVLKAVSIMIRNVLYE